MKNYPLGSDEIKTPLMYNQVAYSDYGVHKETGHIYSKKQGNEWRPRSWSIGGNMLYPFCTIIGDDGHKKAASFHKACCETLKPQPAPTGVSDEEWEQTPASVKRLLHKIWQVNHIDHNHLNFHPDNLEWVTGTENVAKYQEHRISELKKKSEKTFDRFFEIAA
tara:strand:- start:485 stop:976 length:492 start_codon:yes stop_codon:yes gene_type:complete